MPMTGLDAVRVVHGDGTLALDSATLDAVRGELIGVVGPSGSGKSTLLRAVAGLAEVQSGHVFIDGREVTHLPVAERNVSMVFESAALLPFLDVEHNLAWGLRARRLAESVVRSRVATQVDALHLGRLLPRKPRTLSSGERGRVGVGRALVREPSVFLFDEPLAHLDPAERPVLRRRIADLVRASGVPAFYVTHDQSEAMAIADRIAVLFAGSVHQVDTPGNVYDRPANLLVATFIGSPSMGLLPADVVVSDGLAGFRVGARTLPLWRPLPPELQHYVGRRVVLGLRWHDVIDAATGCDPALVTLPGTVVAVERTGRETVVTAAVAAPPVTAPGASVAGRRPEHAEVGARFAANSEVRPGDSVMLAVEAARGHVFDATTGRALLHPQA